MSGNAGAFAESDSDRNMALRHGMECAVML